MQFLGALSHLAEVTKGRRSVTFPWVRKVSVGAHTLFAHPCPGNPLTQGQHRGRFCVHFLAALPHLTAGGRHAFRLIASSVRTNFAEERGEVDFSPPLAQFGSTHAARLLLVAWAGTFVSGARPVRASRVRAPRPARDAVSFAGSRAHARPSPLGRVEALPLGAAGFGLLRGSAACAGGLRPPRGNAAALRAAECKGVPLAHALPQPVMLSGAFEERAVETSPVACGSRSQRGHKGAEDS